MTSHAVSTFGLTTSESEHLVQTLIGATVSPARMRDDELLNLAESLRLINDRLPGLLQRHALLGFWDQIEDEITTRLLDTLTNPTPLDGQTTIFDHPTTGTVEEVSR